MKLKELTVRVRVRTGALVLPRNVGAIDYHPPPLLLKLKNVFMTVF